VLAKPGGDWSNGLSMPYLVINGESVLPCYGGEQFGSRLYSPSALSLPYWHRFKNSWLRYTIACFIGNRLVIVNVLGIFVRSYRFEPTSISITDRLYSFFPYHLFYVFPVSFGQQSSRQIASHSISIDFSSPLIPTGQYCSATGELTQYTCLNNPLTLRITING
jgi:hypothetical protein